MTTAHEAPDGAAAPLYWEEGRQVGYAWASAQPKAARQPNVAKQQADEATRLHFPGLCATHPDVAAYRRGWDTGVAQAQEGGQP